MRHGITTFRRLPPFIMAGPARLLLLLLVASALLFLTPGRSHSVGPSSRSANLIRRFNEAIAIAAVYRRENLRPLHPLVFDPADQTTRVVSLTGPAYSPGPCRLDRDVWVTGVPEVQEKASRFTGDLAPRLRALLGLHPDTPVTHFVSLRVRQPDIFRPTADPDPTRPWPCADPQAPECGETFPEVVGQTHINWMARQMMASYLVSRPLRTDGYPWTRLGYTYDWWWGADRYGASEYVVSKGALVTVESVTPYRDYCRPSVGKTAAADRDGARAELPPGTGGQAARHSGRAAGRRPSPGDPTTARRG
jgi:hypothetical protein